MTDEELAAIRADFEPYPAPRGAGAHNKKNAYVVLRLCSELEAARALLWEGEDSVEAIGEGVADWIVRVRKFLKGGEDDRG